MAVKPNYQQQRAERNRAKELKKQEKLKSREEEAARRRADRAEDPAAEQTPPVEGDDIGKT
jgi:hypothetical protein